RKLIRSNGGTREDAEDIFQEALIILCRKIKTGNFILSAKLSTYLFSVCRFLWNDQQRRQKIAISDDNADHILLEDNLPELFEQEKKALLVEKALQALGERCKELLLLFYHTKMKLRDIAVQMGYSSENTVKNQKYKCLEGARIKLKELMQNA
ncbi:MAG TPA: sigma-70 family RNA polymerase sigma factor, partial [Chitinophaga sp.]